MKRFAVTLLLILATSGCQKPEHTAQPWVLGIVHPVPGRAEYVEAERLLASPATYSGRRIILSGVWSSGFECENLDLESAKQTFGIWVELDDAKIKEKYGNLSRPAQVPSSEIVDQYGRIVSRVVAEGSFFYRRFDQKKGLNGFGHLGASEGLFLIDRILVSEFVGKDQASTPLQEKRREPNRE